MDFYLLILGVIFVCLGYGIYFVYYIKYHKKVIKDMNGFDMAKEITYDYDNINVVESQSFISRYFLKRRVIKLSSKIYSANDIFSLSISLILSCISLLESGYLKFLKKIFPAISYFNISSIIMGVASFILYSKGDARIGIIIGIIILIYQYCYRQILVESAELGRDRVKIKKKEFDMIIKNVCFSNTLFFISSLIFVLRFAVIIIY